MPEEKLPENSHRPDYKSALATKDTLPSLPQKSAPTESTQKSAAEEEYKPSYTVRNKDGAVIASNNPDTQHNIYPVGRSQPFITHFANLKSKEEMLLIF